MIPLSAIFVDASEVERKRYSYEQNGICPAVVCEDQFVFESDEWSECERWVAIKAKDAGVAAVKFHVIENDGSPYVDDIVDFLEQLAGGE